MNQNASKKLHLLDLKIMEFRGLRELTIPCLGRITLLTGKNGVGKTSVLEAVKLWASRGKSASVARILSGSDEYALPIDYDESGIAASSIAPLFFGRHPALGSSIEIGPAAMPDCNRLVIRIVNRDEPFPQELKARWHRARSTGANLTCTTFRKRKFYSIWHNDRILDCAENEERYIDDHEQPFEDCGAAIFERREIGSPDAGEPARVPCVALGPNLLPSSTIAKYLESVALTDEEDEAVRELSIAIGENVERLASVRNRRKRSELSVIARLNQFDTRVPLKSLGDSAVRLLSVVLALSRAKDGFLIIDEVENGFHHTIQEALWSMVLRVAVENNVQVFATTHSRDCIDGFARAAIENKEIGGVLVRLEKEANWTRAVSYDEESLRYVEKHGFEVR